MINVEMKFPLLGIRKEDPNIYVFSKHIGIISKGGSIFYKQLKVFDSAGNSYILIKKQLKGKAPIKYSLMYFQQMYELELTFEESEKICFDDLKRVLFEHIREHSHKWMSLDSISGIEKSLSDCSAYKDLARLFK